MDYLNLKIDQSGLQVLIEAKLMLIKFYQVLVVNILKIMRSTKLSRETNGVKIYYGSENEFFVYDKVVLASHADESLNILSDPTNQEREILSNFKYRKNIAVIHHDECSMPKNKKAWCSWNSSLDPYNKEQSSVTYWLNQLQNLKIE